MNSSPTRELRQRKSLPTKLNGTNVKIRNGEIQTMSLSKKQDSVSKKRLIDHEKEQLPQNIQFMFNTFPSKMSLSAGRFSDSGLDLHGDKFRTFGENVDHIYGVLRNSKRNQSQDCSELRTRKSPRKLPKGPLVDSIQQNMLEINSKKVFGENTIDINSGKNIKLNESEVQKQVSDNTCQYLSLSESTFQSPLMQENNIRKCTNAARKANLHSALAENKNSSIRSFSEKRRVPIEKETSKGLYYSLQDKCPADDDITSDTDEEVSCNIVSAQRKQPKRSKMKVVDYSDSSSTQSSAMSSPRKKSPQKRKRKKSFETSEFEKYPKRPKRGHQSEEPLIPEAASLRTKQLLSEVSEKLKKCQKDLELGTMMKTSKCQSSTLDNQDRVKTMESKRFPNKKKETRGRKCKPKLNNEMNLKAKDPQIVKKPIKSGNAHPRKYPFIVNSIHKSTVKPSQKQQEIPQSSDNKKKEVSKQPVKGVQNNFSPGEEVLARWSDGILYLGHIVKVDEKEKKCFVVFEDQSKYWILFKDLQKGAVDDDDMCCICLTDESEAPNEIVLCDSCGLAYHQECHNPIIEEEILKPEVEWKCRLCVFAATVKEGGAIKYGPCAEALQKMKQSLPYSMENLTWDSQHRVNSQQSYCYCGGPGTWNLKMLQCCRCRQWFHEACIQCLDHPLLNGDKFFVFVCSYCNKGPEYIKRMEMTWTDVIHLALYNLPYKNINPRWSVKKFYTLEEIFTNVKQMWEQFQQPQFENVTDEEKKEKLQSELSSPSNARRFCCNQNLYGLRQRSSPAAPTVIIPIQGQITEDALENLQIVGKGRVKYLLPADCQTPASLNKMKTSLAKSSDSNLAETLSQIQPTITVSNVRPTSGLSLDRLVPFPEDFSGPNHPFKTDVEQKEEKLYNLRKTQLMNYLAMCSDTDCLSQNSTVSCSTDDPTKSIPTPPPSLCGVTDTLPSSKCSTESKTANKKRKLVDDEPVALRQSKRKRVSVSGRYGVDPDFIDFQTFEDVKLFEGEADKMKINIPSYTTSADRLKKGEKYEVLGKRISPNGTVQYLLHFEGLVLKEK